MTDKSTEIIKNYFKKNHEYLVRKLLNPTPIVLYFGAGASYGSDNWNLVKRGLLPPLGKDLYDYLVKSPLTKYWKKIPNEIQSIFSDNFELGLKQIMDNDYDYRIFYKLLFELALYFAQFEPQKNNLYRKLAKKIYQKRIYLSIITLNYEPLLQYSLIENKIIPQSIGIQKTDILDKPEEFISNGYMPIDVIYPHGACQFSFYFPKDWQNEVYNGTGEIRGGGLNQGFYKKNIINFYTKTKNFPGCKPLMCAYEPEKRPFAKNYFIDYQQDFYNQVIKEAQRIIVVGVNCNYEQDRHLWEAMEKTSAEIIFIEPSEQGKKKIIEWGKSNTKIIQSTFKDAFDEICNLAFLN